jgi:predicted PhzF superfamily epimerase YddE/YHI9
VTVFLPKSPLLPKTQVSLAKQCSWESVVVNTPSDASKPRLGFFMPSGLEVSFCAHAALGGATIASTSFSESFEFTPQMFPEESYVVDFPNHSREEATLKMTTLLRQTPVSHSPSLQRTLREHLGVSGQMLAKNHPALPPTFCNSSIVAGRSKTLVHLSNLDDLRNSIKTPRVSDKASRSSFASACAAIDESTGIYLYSHVQDVTTETNTSISLWECRQFPRASGYPEDPATGIAAAALAASLVKQYSGGGIPPSNYHFYQGMSMRRPSLIQVVNLELHKDNNAVSFGLQGRVKVDDKEIIEVDEEV